MLMRRRLRARRGMALYRLVGLTRDGGSCIR